MNVRISRAKDRDGNYTGDPIGIAVFCGPDEAGNTRFPRVIPESVVSKLNDDLKPSRERLPEGVFERVSIKDTKNGGKVANYRVQYDWSVDLAGADYDD